MGRVFIGTSGYNYKHWKGLFYPEDLAQKNWFGYYSEHFPTVEINATFYRGFPKKVFQGWRDRVPPDFIFAIKGSRYISHIKRLEDVKDEIKRFFEAASGLEKKLSVVLWQFPSSFRFNDVHVERLSHFMALLPSGVKQAFEFRDKSWFTPPLFSLMQDHGSTVVLNDTASFAITDKAVGKFTYIRFHGPTGLYSSNYSGKQLQDWAGRIREYAKRGDVYCYFNNDSMGYAVENAKELMNLSC